LAFGRAIPPTTGVDRSDPEAATVKQRVQWSREAGYPGRAVPFARHRQGEIRHGRDRAEWTPREISEKPGEIDALDSIAFLESEPAKSVPFSRLRQRAAPPRIWMTSHGDKLGTLNTPFCEVAADPGKMIRPASLEGRIQQVMCFSDGSNLTGTLL